MIINQLLEGIRPSRIASASQLPIQSVVEETMKAINEHRIRRSQVLATLDNDLQDQVALWFPSWNKRPKAVSPEFIHNQLRETNAGEFDLEIEEVRLYLTCLQRGFRDGELYELLCEIERTLHTKIRQILVENHGPEEAGWWRKGVPQGIREDCACRRERDESDTAAQNPLYNYTTLGQLKGILKFDENAHVFKDRLPLAAKGKPPNMKLLDDDLAKLVKIRNKVMHPIGTVPPNEEEFFVVRELQAKFDLTKWR